MELILGTNPTRPEITVPNPRAAASRQSRVSTGFNPRMIPEDLSDGLFHRVAGLSIVSTRSALRFPGSEGSVLMPKKKTVAKKASPKKAATKKATTRKAVSVVKAKAVKSLAPPRKQAARSTAGRAASAPQSATRPTVSTPPEPAPATLGRPLVTQEEKLYMLFHDDYQCRQVFEFLRVETVKELEEYTPQQIVHLMSRPIRLTVDRIRQRLAEFKRSLKDDTQFAAEFQHEKPAPRKS